MKKSSGRLLAAALASFSTFATTFAFAETLTIGSSVTPSALDPQLSLLTSDVGYYRHIFDPLFKVDTQLQLQPGLATEAKALDDTTWEIKLRSGVKFHDGSEFDADDVVFSLKRLGTVPGNDGLAAQYVSPIKDISVIDAHTLRLTTDGPTPDIPKRLAQISILSAGIGDSVTSEDFNTGKAAVGTGPFKLVEWRRGDQLVLARNDAYWGEKSQFDRVVFKAMTNPATRVAALEAGDVDMIDNVPPIDAKRLMQRQDLNVAQAPSGRVVFLQFDSVSPQAPLTTSADGKPLEANPFADNRVRKALSLAVNRDLIIERVMDGLAVKANQGIPKGFEGYATEIEAPRYDAEAAKALLAEAGYPDGFATTLACPNDRYVNDAAICQAIGQMWTRIGLKVAVDTSPKAVYFNKVYAGTFGAHMLAWGNTAGDSISFLKSIVGSPDKAHGRGSQNQKYLNAKLDVQIDKAALTIDDAQRAKLLQQAMVDAIQDNAFLPLHATAVIAATRKGLTYTPQADETTMATFLRKQ
ncbi:ABC transporter substrate-binding protein [Sinorhizobium fredii]|uniref:Solute-binding protein family 5 domain-containing protein n=1 Tax=Sinorhizobium fredii (strain HH103) TaxID=1117943 RepID=G9AAC5_SINF1|nr:ABC transporter substrate-binding protein [Sinorhizobium fredii]CCE97029.1 Periplasmic oligopeptide/nickel-binding protein Flags: Precursor [Sinorhizobium fredii HH103]